MKYVELGNVFDYQKKSKIKAAEGKEIGKYKFFTSSNMQKKFINEAIFAGEYLIFGTGGKASINYCNDEFSVSTDNLVVKVDKSLLSKYVYYYFKGNMAILEKGFKGASIKHISKDYINSIKIPIYEISKQETIVKQLDSINELIIIKEKQLEEVIQSIQNMFIKMFGDLRFNDKKWNMKEFNEFIEYMADIGSNGSNQNVAANLKMLDSDDYALMVRTVNFTADDFEKNMKYVSKDTYEYFKKSKVYGGEIIMNKIGSPGECWIMPKLNKPVSLGLNQFLIRLNDEANTKFIYHLLNSNYGKQELNKRINGAVTKSIGKIVVKEILIPLVPIELQNEFANFVTKVEEQKELINKEIDKLKYLFDTKMNEYFG